MTPEDPATAGGPAPAGDSPADSSAGGAPKKIRRLRRRRVRAKPAAEAGGDTPRAAASEAPARREPAASDGGEPKPKAKKKRKRRVRRRKPDADREAGTESPPAADEAAGEAIPPLPDDGEGSGDGKSRRKRRRRGGRGRKSKDGATADGGGEDAVDGEAPKRSRSRGRGAKGKDGDGGSEKSSSRRSRSKSGDGKSRERGGRSRDGRGRRDERREGRGSRERDPRAIDIVPRVPTAEEAAKEKILLVNARDRDEARIALLVDGRLEEIYLELAAAERSSAGHIYRGRVQNVERGIGAAFVDLGRGLTGFLHASDLPLTEGEDSKQEVTDRIKAGDEVIVQITRDSIGRKGPALTGRISFPGRYLVLMPFTARSGISRRIPQGPERDRVRKLLRKLEVPEGMGVIIRTASESTDLAALDADLAHLLQEWQIIKRKAAEPGQPGLLRGEGDLAERSVRDIMPGDVTRIVVDKDDLAGRIHRLLRVWYPTAAIAADEASTLQVKAVSATLDAPRGESRPEPMPVEPEVEEEPADAEPSSDEPGDAGSEAPAADDEGGAPATSDEPSADGDAAEPEPEPVVVETDAERLARLEAVARAMPEVELHTDAMPLFHQYGAETQLEDAFRRSTRLPSGGSIVIDPTEALVAVDVNSGRLTDETDPERTALVTNLEAVEETARQLRLRDLGGLVVIDFIDMRERKSRRQVEMALKEALSSDRARIRMGRMGPFGLVVLSRQRIRQALNRVTHESCVDCAGTGRRRQVSGLGLRVLREMQARVARSRGRGGLEVRAPKEVISWIKKNRPAVLKELKRECSGPVTLEADSRLAVDGWAMKGAPPPGGTLDPEDE